MRLWAVLIAAAALTACQQQPAGYTPEYRLNFVRACEAQRPPAGICQCTWERIETEIPRADFDALERMPAAQRDASPIQARIRDLALECAGKPTAP